MTDTCARCRTDSTPTVTLYSADSRRWMCGHCLLLENAELRAVVTKAVAIAKRRPHDGSQLDEDLEGLLLAARAAMEASNGR